MNRVMCVWTVLLLLSLTLPLQAQTPVPESCSESVSGLVIGEQGEVTPGAPVNLRVDPGTDSELVGQIPEGGVFTVLDGPVCVDGRLWWQVNYTESVGWTLEGDGGSPWLVPGRTPVSSDADAFLPDDLLFGLAFTGAGGPGETTCSSDDSPVFIEVQMMRLRAIPDQDVFRPGDEAVIQAMSGFLSTLVLCVIADNPAVPALIAPDGETQALSARDDPSVGYRVYDFPPEMIPVAGTWQIQADDVSLSLTLDYQQPGMVWYGNNQVIVTGLLPDERFLLLSQVNTDTFNMFETRANADGTRTLDLSGDSVHILRTTLMTESGGLDGLWVLPPVIRVSDLDPDLSDGVQRLPLTAVYPALYRLIWQGEAFEPDPGSIACPGSSSVRLRMTEPARALLTTPVHEGPDFDSEQVGELSPGDSIIPTWGIYCSDNTTWWHTDAGYVPESQGLTYFLTPQ